MHSRRKPVCHTCGLFMEGHKRDNGSPVCPTADKRIISPGRSLISPPPSPSPRNPGGDHTLPLTESTDPSFQREASIDLCRKLKFEQLAAGGYRRRNPNWESGADVRQAPQSPNKHLHYREGSPAASIVSTVLIGEGYEEEMVSSDDDSVVSGSSGSSASTEGRSAYPQTPLGRQASFVGRLADYARFNRGMVTVFRARPDELSTIQRGARRRGVHTATMPTPPSSGVSSPYSSPTTTEGNESTYVVLGKSASFVKEVAARGLQQSTNDNESFNDIMPGTSRKTHAMDAPRHITIPELIAIVICTSCLVVFGLSLIPSSS